MHMRVFMHLKYFFFFFLEMKQKQKTILAKISLKYLGK